MSEYAYFYNSENGDRVYDADSFSNWLKKFFTTGVFEGDCQVTALGNMVVNLAPGYANIMGKVKELENQTFTLEPADGSYPRIDTIVIERNDTDRDITAKLVTGQLSGNTPAPTPRVWENGVYQLIVAEVYVAAGATEVTQADITDKRSDPDVCGIVAGTVTEMDFSQFTAQFESYFAEFEASNLEEFDEWFQHMKDQLDTDAAGHLQNEIDDINTEIATIVNDLGAKNMLPNNKTTRTVNGVTFTANSDGSVTVNGTASSLASLFLIGDTSAWGSNQYKNCILSGCPSGGSGDSYRIVMQTSSDGSTTSKTYLEDGNGVLIDDDNQYCKIYIRIAGGYTANNLIFKPMIRPSNIKDDTYVPYAQTNKELTDNLAGFKFYPTGTQFVAYIEGHGWYNADGKYVIWGTATANALVEASPNTYYGRQSEEDCRGEVGADTAIPFSGGAKETASAMMAPDSNSYFVYIYQIINEKDDTIQSYQHGQNTAGQLVGEYIEIAKDLSPTLTFKAKKQGKYRIYKLSQSIGGSQSYTFIEEKTCNANDDILTQPNWGFGGLSYKYPQFIVKAM